MKKFKDTFVITNPLDGSFIMQFHVNKKKEYVEIPTTTLQHLAQTLESREQAWKREVEHSVFVEEENKKLRAEVKKLETFIDVYVNTWTKWKKEKEATKGEEKK